MPGNNPVIGHVLKDNGDNMLDVNTILGLENLAMRKKISAAQAWPVAGDWQYSNAFHPFRRLPQELQNKIWGFVAASQDPRVVNIYVINGQLRCNVVTPKILHTSSDSRKEALLIYHELVFDGHNTNCYINFDIDTVFFDTTIPLIKVFGEQPAYPIFQANCRNLALLKQPVDAFYKTLSSRFVRLEKLAIVNFSRSDYYRDGDGYFGNIAGLYPPAHNKLAVTFLGFPTAHAQRRQELEKIAKAVPAAVVNYFDADREDPSKKIMTQEEKEAIAKKRKEERDAVADARIDEALAIQLQRDIDLRKLEVEVQESPFNDEEGEEDQFGFALGLDYAVFSDDFMIYGN